MLNRISHQFALSKQGAKNYLQASCLSFINTIVEMLPISFFLLFVSDMLSFISTGKPFKSIYFYLAFGLLIFILIALSNYFSYTSLYVATYTESAASRIRLAEKLRTLPLSFYSRKDVSELSNIVLNDVADLEGAFSHALPQINGIIAFLCVAGIGLTLTHWPLAIVSFIVVPLSFLVYKLSFYYEQKAHKDYFSLLTEQSEEFQETIEKVKEIRFLNQKQTTKKALYALLEKQEKTHIKTEMATAISQGLISGILQSGMGLVILFGGYWWLQDELSLFQLFVFLLATSRIYSVIIELYEKLSMVRYVRIRIDRINQLYQESVQEGETTPVFPHYDVQVQHLAFGYHPEKPVIEGINFKAKEGQVTALVGPSGSGKTTVFKLLSRLYDYTEGSITIGNENIQAIDTEYLFTKIAIVFQDVTLFNTTIKENIRIGRNNATDEEVLQAAKLAQCDEFALKSPAGYETLIGENGSRLSGGERQRISIARAFLKNAPIVLLDETSSALDSENELAVQTALSALIKQKTVIVIAHRLRTIETASHIIVLKDGKIAEQGTKEELLANNQLFKRMYEYEVKTFDTPIVK
ncbi:ABC transporter ATP-binding protein [Isobaculum melis]|uniref:ATP-binding cassette, subfamily B n=1 Tax=Isobaculum melis TaxID=142588 RepID=A0A1H9PRJ4_9LACT|nr:ABC transporter ATP-binding protein [Isobaculum melis]SER50824.1 ATP-binding cassette, subfamily B [Isobaculum melis]